MLESSSKLSDVAAQVDVRFNELSMSFELSNNKLSPALPSLGEGGIVLRDLLALSRMDGMKLRCSETFSRGALCVSPRRVASTARESIW